MIFHNHLHAIFIGIFIFSFYHNNIALLLIDISTFYIISFRGMENTLLKILFKQVNTLLKNIVDYVSIALSNIGKYKSCLTNHLFR